MYLFAGVSAHTECLKNPDLSVVCPENPTFTLKLEQWYMQTVLSLSSEETRSGIENFAHGATDTIIHCIIFFAWCVERLSVIWFSVRLLLLLYWTLIISYCFVWTLNKVIWLCCWCCCPCCKKARKKSDDDFGHHGYPMRPAPGGHIKLQP